MTRDEEFAEVAAKYIEADDDVLECEREAHRANVKLGAAMKDREALRKKLAEFVGTSLPTRNAVVGKRLVRAELHRDSARVVVSVEGVIISRGAV